MAYDNTKPADNDTWDIAAGLIRDNWDALEAIFGVDLAMDPMLSQSITNEGAFVTKDPWHDIRAYGALVDGVTDDSSAVQDAMDAAAGGGTVFFPPGTTALGSVGWTGLILTTTTKVTLRGDPRSSILKVLYAPSQSVTGASSFKQVFRLNTWTDALITGLTVDMNAQSSTGAFGLDSCTRTTVRDCYIYGGDDNESNGITSLDGTNNKYIDNHINGGGTGIYLGVVNSGDAENNALVQGNHCIDNTSDAISGTMVNCSIVNNYCEGATGSGIELTSGTDVSKDTTINGNICVGCNYGISS
ncbi:MAG: hypothetical protein JRE40_11990, partial [Deltaproteobacteria bacterium]|nr:hypothetical protein [Deltaproteobacteria bacterium]